MLNNTKGFSCFSKTPVCTLNKLIADFLIHWRKHPRNLALRVSSINKVTNIFWCILFQNQTLNIVFSASSFPRTPTSAQRCKTNHHTLAYDQITEILVLWPLYHRYFLSGARGKVVDQYEGCHHPSHHITHDLEKSFQCIVMEKFSLRTCLLLLPEASNAVTRDKLPPIKPLKER